MEVSPAELLKRGRDSSRRHAWADAYASLSAAAAASPLAAPDLELFATAAHLVGQDRVSLDAWARAHAEYVQQQDLPHAARCAFWLVLDLLNSGESARANGWLVRAQRLLDEAGRDCPERGLLWVLSARVQARTGDLEAALAEVRRAAAIATRFTDPDLRAFTRLIEGQILLRSGCTAEAGGCFDEVMVAVTIGEVSPIGVGVIYCAVIDVCHHAFDLARSREWTAALSRWCSEQPELVAFRGQCLVHRAELMRLSGDWDGARAEAERACGLLLASPALDSGASPARYPVGAAFYEVAEIHRLRGEFDRAHEAYRQASLHDAAVEPGLAQLRLGEGRVEQAESAIRLALAQRQPPFARALVLGAAVDILLAAGDVPAARTARSELESLCDVLPAPFLRALTADATASVLLAEGDAHTAIAPLRDAWMAWQELEAPYHAARVRVRLGLAYHQLGDRDAGELELEAARAVFDRLQAAPDVAYVKQLQRGDREPGTPLTRRELQVLGLVAAGRTNRAIGEALGISERTVDRHVSNILLKLGLPSRSAATAYAYQHGLIRTA